jgi:hypothetical protein
MARKNIRCTAPAFFLALGLIASCTGESNKQETFIPDREEIAVRYFENDASWYLQNIPFLDCPDDSIMDVSYYFWKKAKMHLRNIGQNEDTEAGYIMTEMTPLHTWSGPYGGMSMAACMHINELRWLREERYLRDYVEYWFTAGQPPKGLLYQFTNWLPTAVLEAGKALGDSTFVTRRYFDMVRNYEYWHRMYYNREFGLYGRIQIREGMERSISSHCMTVNDCNAEDTQDHRVVFNTYMYTDFLTLQKVASMLGYKEDRELYGEMADSLRDRILEQLWDDELEFFIVKKEDGSLFRGRELVGYIPWVFNMKGTDTPSHARAWLQLRDTLGFNTPFGPPTAEKRHPYYNKCYNSCSWGGPTWPYTSQQTLYALANLLRNYEHRAGMNTEDYLDLLKKFTRIHYKDGLPYAGESHNPEGPNWKSDINPRGLHYNLSGYNDVIITGLAGLVPRLDDTLEIRPLINPEWNYFCLEGLPYHGHNLTILWDRDGKRYNRGEGFKAFIDGKLLAEAGTIEPLVARIPSAVRPEVLKEKNLAVNTTGYYEWGKPTEPRPWIGHWVMPTGFPVPFASYTCPEDSLWEANDGNIWYEMKPAAPHNRWSSKGSGNEYDWYGIDFGEEKTFTKVRLYFLSNEKDLGSPRHFVIQHLVDDEWVDITPKIFNPVPNTMTEVKFGTVTSAKVRALFRNTDNKSIGLVEMEVY